MRRLARRLFTLCSAVSLVLLAVTVATLWVRNWSSAETIGVKRDRWADEVHYRAVAASITSSKGRLYVTYNRWGRDFTVAIDPASVAEYRARNPGEMKFVHRRTPIAPEYMVARPTGSASAGSAAVPLRRRPGAASLTSPATTA